MIYSMSATIYVGSTAPFGYNRIAVKEGKNVYHTLTERKDQADIVRLIFEWYCNEDIWATAICRRLEKMKVKTKNGFDDWDSSMIFYILENVHYIGYIRWNWRKTRKIIEDQEIRKLRPKAKEREYLIFDGKHDGIVSEELFNKAKEIRGKRHRTKTNLTLKNPLSGILYCKCGHKMGYNTYRKDGVEYDPPKVVCNNQIRCGTGSAVFSEVMEHVCNALRKYIEEFDMVIDNNQSESIKLHKNILNTLEAKLEEIELKELNQWEALYDP